MLWITAAILAVQIFTSTTDRTFRFAMSKALRRLLSSFLSA